MAPRRRSYLRAVAPQLIVIGIVLLFHVLALFAIIPPSKELLAILAEWLPVHGMIAIAAVSFVENFAGLGVYFPGSVALLTAMSATAGSPGRAFATYIAIVIPAVLANIASFGIGRITRMERSHERPAKGRSRRALTIWYISTYWHPQLSAITASASGAEGIPFRRYLAYFLPTSLIWSMAWALLLYHAGETISSPSVLELLLYLYLGGWLIRGLTLHRRSLVSRTRPMT